MGCNSSVPASKQTAKHAPKSLPKTIHESKKQQQKTPPTTDTNRDISEPLLEPPEQIPKPVVGTSVVEEVAKEVEKDEPKPAEEENQIPEIKKDTTIEEVPVVKEEEINPTTSTSDLQENSSVKLSVTMNMTVQHVEMPILKSTLEISSIPADSKNSVVESNNFELPPFDEDLSSLIAQEEIIYKEYCKKKDDLPSPSTQYFKTLDEYVNRPVSDELVTNIPKLAEYLTRYCKTQMGKTRAIFVFTTARISYDSDAINNNDTKSCSTISALSTGKSVCAGFASALLSLGEQCDLEILTLSGYAKGVNHKEGMTYTDVNHAWNCVRLDGEWRFFDNTWSEGHGEYVNGTLVSTKIFQEAWFNVCPEIFAISHWSADTPSIPLIDFLTKTQFETMPRCPNSEYMTPADFRMLVADNKIAVPTFFSNDDFTILKAPYFLKEGRRYTFKVKNHKVDGNRGCGFNCGKGLVRLPQNEHGYWEGICTPLPKDDKVTFCSYHEVVEGEKTRRTITSQVEYKSRMPGSWQWVLTDDNEWAWVWMTKSKNNQTYSLYHSGVRLLINITRDNVVIADETGKELETFTKDDISDFSVQPGQVVILLSYRSPLVLEGDEAAATGRALEQLLFDEPNESNKLYQSLDAITQDLSIAKQPHTIPEESVSEHEVYNSQQVVSFDDNLYVSNPEKEIKNQSVVRNEPTYFDQPHQEVTGSSYPEMVTGVRAPRRLSIVVESVSSSQSDERSIGNSSLSTETASPSRERELRTLREAKNFIGNANFEDAVEDVDQEEATFYDPTIHLVVSPQQSRSFSEISEKVDHRFRRNEEERALLSEVKDTIKHMAETQRVGSRRRPASPTTPKRPITVEEIPHRPSVAAAVKRKIKRIDRKNREVEKLIQAAKAAREQYEVDFAERKRVAKSRRPRLCNANKEHVSYPTETAKQTIPLAKKESVPLQSCLVGSHQRRGSVKHIIEDSCKRRLSVVSSLNRKESYMGIERVESDDDIISPDNEPLSRHRRNSSIRIPAVMAISGVHETTSPASDAERVGTIRTASVIVLPGACEIADNKDDVVSVVSESDSRHRRVGSCRTPSIMLLPGVREAVSRYSTPKKVEVHNEMLQHKKSSDSLAGLLVHSSKSSVLSPPHLSLNDA